MALGKSIAERVTVSDRMSGYFTCWVGTTCGEGSENTIDKWW